VLPGHDIDRTRVPVLKLHGSVTWVENETSEVEVTHGVREVFLDPSLMIDPFSRRKVQVGCMEDIVPRIHGTPFGGTGC
jgi:hypothetical protein